MIERKGDMFEEYLSPEVVYVITSNGYVKNNGQAVMGRGVAQRAASLHKDIPAILGDLLLTYGNRPFVLPYNFVTLPVKHKWDEKADVELIDRSLCYLRNLKDVYNWDIASGRQIYLPRPGCGNGQLDWGQVQGFVSDWLDYDNVTVWSL